jgi:hypothetical protein
MTDETRKICRGPCERRLELGEFALDRGKRDRHKSVCKQCDAASKREAYRERAEADGKRYRQRGRGFRSEVAVPQRNWVGEPLPTPVTVEQIFGKVRSSDTITSDLRRSDRRGEKRGR